MVSIITINYNGYKDTCELINSIRKYEIYPYEIIVVDHSPTKEEALRLEMQLLFHRNKIQDLQEATI